MRTVWKFDIYEWIGEIRIPRGAKIIHAARQSSLMTLWAEVDSQAEDVSRGVAIIGTGHPMPDISGSHVGTVMDGEFVWHVYVEDEATP